MTEAILLQLHNREKTIFWSLIGILFVFAGLYMYFINATIHNVVAKQNLENRASSLTLAIGSQEFQYIQMRNNVTLAMAHSLGYKEVLNKVFISKKSSATQVSYLPH